MANSKRDRYRSERNRIEEKIDSGEISESAGELILEFCDAKDPKVHSVTDDDDGKTDSTLVRYANLLHRVENLAEFSLSDTTAGEINRFMDEVARGTVDGVKDEGLTEGSIKNYQGTLRKFYEYHDQLGIKKKDIALANPDNQSIDPRDLFDKEDIQAIRKAASHPRDKALVDLLLYTGQRRSAILNLRNKDIDVDSGTFYLNEDRGDLKGARGKRPLLYAEKSVRDWYNQHPKDDDPDAFFITHKYNWEDKEYEPGERLDDSTIYRQLQRIGKQANVNKPMNAHNFRHTFVTICKRDYGMDNDTIKRLIGHRPESSIMEETYAHLTDDDVIAAAERATGIRDDEPDSPLTPDVCDVCGEVIERDNAKACPGCGTVFTPDAHAVQEQIEDNVKQSYKEADPKDEELIEGVEAIERLLDDPEAKQMLLDRLGEDQS